MNQFEIDQNKADYLAAVRLTKKRAIAAYGEDRILAISNWGAGVWLTDNTYVTADNIGLVWQPVSTRDDASK